VAQQPIAAGPRFNSDRRFRGGIVTFHVKGFLVFVAFAALLMVAAEPPLGIAALAGWVVIEGLSWNGVAGLGRGRRT
jgi:hypothetical protein